MSTLSNEELVQLLYAACTERINAYNVKDYKAAKAAKDRASFIGKIVMERVREGTWGPIVVIGFNTDHSCSES